MNAAWEPDDIGRTTSANRLGSRRFARRFQMAGFAGLGRPKNGAGFPPPAFPAGGQRGVVPRRRGARLAGGPGRWWGCPGFSPCSWPGRFPAPALPRRTPESRRGARRTGIRSARRGRIRPRLPRRRRVWRPRRSQRRLGLRRVPAGIFGFGRPRRSSPARRCRAAIAGLFPPRFSIRFSWPSFYAKPAPDGKRADDDATRGQAMANRATAPRSA